MAGGGNISQRLSLEGADDIISKLASIGQSGEQAFARLKSGVESVTSRFSGLGAPLHDLEQKIKSVADVLGVSFGIGAGGAAAAILGFTKSAADGVHAVEELAQQTGSSIEEMSGISSAFAAFGVSSDDLSQAFRRLAVRVETEWPAIQKSIRDAAATAIGDNLAVEQSLQGLEKAENELAQVRLHNARQQIEDIVGIRSASLSLNEAEYKLAIAEGRKERNPEYERALELDRLRLEVEEKRQKLADAKAKREEDEKLAPIREQAAQYAVEQAQLAIEEKQKKAAEDSANSIEALTGYVNKLAEAGKRASGATDFGGVNIQYGLKPRVSTEGVNASPDNIIKGIIAAVGPGVEQIGEVGNSLSGLATAGPKAMNVLLKFADVLKGLPDPALRMAVAVRLLGRGVSVELVNALSQGSGAILRQRDHLRELGLTYTEEEGKQSTAMVRAKNTLVDTLDIVKNKIGAAFAPTATQGITEFTDFVIGKFRGLPEALRNVLSGVSFDEFAKGAGANLSPEELLKVHEWQQWIEKIKSYLKDLGSSLGSAFSAVMAVLDRIAAAINRLFGTKLSGDELGLGLLIGHFTGINNAILEVIKTVGILVIALSRLNPIVAGAGAAVAMRLAADNARSQSRSNPQVIADAQATEQALQQAVKAGWDTVWNAVAGFGSRAWDKIKGDGEAAVQAVKAAWDGIVAFFDDLWTRIATAAEGAWGKIVEKVQAAIDKLKEFFSLKSGDSGSQQPQVDIMGNPTGFATGGRPPTDRASMVGEHGPELFVPDTAGTILPHSVTTMLGRIGGSISSSLGGLIDGISDSLSSVAAPAFGGSAPAFAGAAGGASLHPVTLVLPSGQSVSGFQGTPDAVSQIGRYSIDRQNSSGGSAPSWVR